MDQCSWDKIDRESIWHPFTPTPFVGPKAKWSSARGAFLYDESKKRYFDATSSWWCQIHGHCHPKLVKAISEQAARMDQVLFAPHTHEPAIQLSMSLLSKTKGIFNKVFFSDDGSTAVETALKMSAQYWANRGNKKRKYFLSIEGGYHGDTLGAVSVSHISTFHQYFHKLIQPSLKSTIPYCYRCPLEMSYPSCDLACLSEVSQILKTQGDEIIALIVEPLVLGAAGMISYPKEYLENLIRLCREKEILVIFDEVFTGFGRTGTLFAFEQFESTPDLICLSKGLTSGMLPLAVTLANEKVAGAFEGLDKTFYHGHTFTANPITCALAYESLQLFDEEDTLAKNKKLIAVMQNQLKRFGPLPHVGEVRHVGMIWAVEVVLDRDKKTLPSPPNGPTWNIARALWEKGIWSRPLNNVLYTVPPYCTLESELQEYFDLLFIEVQKEAHFN